MDIFDNPILCKKCKLVMKPELISKNGFNLRTLRCKKCKEAIVHPVDKQEYNEFMKLKKKDFEVKMRMVGNSYAVSIPREIVDFMREQEKMIDDMVKLNFENAGRLSLMFHTPKTQEQERESMQGDSRVIRAREVRVVRGNKPIFHSKEFADSAHPEKNKKKVFKAKDFDEELENDR
jgi:antitoxin component of MazEF toxin-antitoxin module